MESLAVLIYILNGLTILVNTHLIFALCKLKKIKLMSFRLVMYLSLSDVFSGLFGIALDLNRTKNKKPTQSLYYITLFHMFFTNFSIILILLIAIDRFIHMKYLARYPIIMTQKRAIIAVVSSALFTFHTVLVVLILPHYQTRFIVENIRGYMTYRVILSFIYIVLMLATFALYLSTYLTIAKKIGNLRSFDLERNGIKPCDVKNDGIRQTPDTTSTKSLRRRSRWPPRNPANDFIKGMLFVVCCLIVLVLPNISFSVAETITYLHGNNDAKQNIINAAPTVRKITYPAFLLNSTLNATFFIVCCSDIRLFTKNFYFACFKVSLRWVVPFHRFFVRLFVCLYSYFTSILFLVIYIHVHMYIQLIQIETNISFTFVGSSDKFENVSSSSSSEANRCTSLHCCLRQFRLSVAFRCNASTNTLGTLNIFLIILCF